MSEAIEKDIIDAVEKVTSASNSAADTFVASRDTWLRAVSYLRVPRPPRAKRRRSRQCRGKRARNYVRAVMREAEGSHANSQLSKVVADATATGALAAAQRMQARRVSEASP